MRPGSSEGDEQPREGTTLERTPTISLDPGTPETTKRDDDPLTRLAFGTHGISTLESFCFYNSCRN